MVSDLIHRHWASFITIMLIIVAVMALAYLILM